MLNILDIVIRLSAHRAPIGPLRHELRVTFALLYLESQLLGDVLPVSRTLSSDCKKCETGIAVGFHCSRSLPSVQHI